MTEAMHADLEARPRVKMTAIVFVFILLFFIVGGECLCLIGAYFGEIAEAPNLARSIGPH